MSQAVISLRERKKERTRAALAEAAIELFERQGYDRTTVEDIAAAADVSPRTFFRYFATKDDVLLGEFAGAVALLRNLLDERPRDEPVLASLRSIAEMMTADGDTETTIARRVIPIVTGHLGLTARYLELLNEIERSVADWVADRLGEPATAMRPRIVAAAVMAARRVATETWIESGSETSLAEALATGLDLLAAGVDVRPANP